MAKSIAKIRGVALRPGVSKNNRLYTREAIEKAVARAKDRIATGDEPLTVLTHHLAGDDSTRIVGRLTDIDLAEDGSATYEWELADTDHGRNVLNLIDTTGGDPFLKGVSIRGAWLGPVRRKVVDGQSVETAEDLELDGVDLTKTPGVPGARIDSVSRTGSSASEANGRALIFESFDDAAVTITEELDEARSSRRDDDMEDVDEDSMDEDDAEEKGAPALKSGKPAKAQTKASRYADPGYQDDKMPRYAIDTLDQARAAWSYINQAKNATKYTANQLKQVKGRIIKALRSFGVKVNTKEGWIAIPGQLLESMNGCGCCAECAESGGTGAVNLMLDNGMFTVAINSYKIDVDDLAVIGNAMMRAATDAVCAIDPDMDGDVDVPGADDDEYTDGDMESAPEINAESSAESHAESSEPPSNETPAVQTATGDTIETKEPAVPEPTENAAAPAAEVQESAPAVAEQAAPAAMPAVTLSADQFAALLDRLAPAPAAAPAAESAAPAAAVAEQAAPAAEQVQESEDQRVERLVQERLTRAVQEHVEANGVQRRGLVTQENVPGAGAAQEFDYPSDWPQKPMHEFTREEWNRFVNPMIEGSVMGRHSVYRQGDAA